MSEPEIIDIHLVSDSTGETLSLAVAAVLAQYPGVTVRRHLHVFVRAEREIKKFVATLRRAPGPVFFTVLNAQLREWIETECAALGVAAADPLDAITHVLSASLGPPRSDRAQRPGGQYVVDAAYFERMSALDFAISHDDGAAIDRLRQADVILTGVSRTSKTPTCIYLAYRGVRAANAPLLPGRAAPDGLLSAAEEGVPVIALTANPVRLAQIRKQRLQALDQSPDEAEYADLDQIRREVSEARLLFERMDWPVIDVTRRSIEETAAAIQDQLRRMGGEQ